MMRRFVVCLASLSLLAVLGCDALPTTDAVKTNTAAGVNVKISTDPEGLTVEQRNVRDRLIADNKPGAIKHLYVISPLSGQVLIYSTVRGKVTSSGKRLEPSTVAGGNGSSYTYGYLMPQASGQVAHESLVTHEVLGDDGTYGPSADYLYWWDAKGVYHQHYLTGGQIIHVSDQPLAVKSVVLNMETEGR